MAKGGFGVAVMAGVLLAATDARATPLDPAFTETVLVTHPDLVGATGFAWAPDGSNRLFVAIQSGAIRVIKDGALLPTPFATVTPLFTTGENGLIGITFDPNFVVSKHLYVFATAAPLDQHIIRYTVAGDVGSERTLVLDKLPSGSTAHSGGGIAFGPDGKIYFGIGDNTTMANAEDLTTLAGKIGRLNLDGSPVADNPFVDGPGGKNDHVFALGLRNPFSLAFQPGTGLLWVGSVGWVYEQIFVVRKGEDAGWGTKQYENNQPAGFITPVIKYRIGGTDSPPVLPGAMSGAVRAGGIVTVTTTTPHRFRLGEKITLKAPEDPSFSAPGFVKSIPGPMTFTMAQTGPDATSGGGHAFTTAPGGCVTGGAFYDVAGPPDEYRGSYVFGDYNTGLVLRAALAPDGSVITSIVDFAQLPAGQVDTELGPDGALYFIGHAQGTVYRLAPPASTQAVLVSPAHLAMAEGEPRLAMVRLARDPGGPVTVSVTRTAGDTDLAVSAGATLSFDSQNFARPQPVTIVAGRDPDSVDDAASFTVSAPGVPGSTLLVAARDQFAGGAPADAGADVPVAADAGADVPSASDAGADVPMAIDARGEVPGALDAGSGVPADAAPGTPPDGAVSTDAPRDARGDTGDGSVDRAGGGDDSDGCGCRIGGAGQASGAAWLLLGAGLVVVARRRGRGRRP